MKILWKALPLFFACLLTTALAHNISVQVWLSPSPLSARDSAAYESLERLAASHQFSVDSSSNPSSLETSNLQNRQVVLFLNRTGADLNATQRADIESFVGVGGGFVGIHEGALSTPGWAAFDTLLGASLGSLLASQPMTILNTDKVHPATAELPFRHAWDGPWYDFTQGPRGQAHILLSVRLLPGSSFSGEHPVSWARQFGRGRVFATTLGANADDYSTHYLEDHLIGAIEWAGAAQDGDPRVTTAEYFDQSVLADNIEGCMAIDVASDGRVFYAEKKGKINLWNPQSQSSKRILDWSNTGPDHKVFSPFENGIFGMALAPGFPQVPYIYIHYSFTGTNPWGPGTGQQRVSRLVVIGDSIDASSEEVLLEYDFDRDAQIHSGGCLAFDLDGNLFIAAGDNCAYGTGATLNPYNPVDERPGNSLYDAQRTAGNSADFRGKILRITPSAVLGGGYTLPAGNLFSPTDSTLGEIYIMGVRNPFKICVDPNTGWLAWGDVGPDATAYDSLRGPIGRDEYNVAKQAGYYGWPYMLANNLPFREYDFATNTSGAWNDPNQLVNNSPNNTGIRQLPVAMPALMWMRKTIFTPEWPELGTGNVTAMAGAFYQYDSAISDPNKLPEYYDGTLFIMDWTRNWIKTVRLDSAGEVVKIEPFLDSLGFIGPMDLKVGPDGALYLMEWRTDKWGGTTSRIIQIRYAAEGRSPIAIANVDKNNGSAPLGVQLDGSDSYDPDGMALNYNWDFGDGSPSATGMNPGHIFAQEGVYTVTLEVENTDGKTGQTELTVTVGNTRPVVSIAYPVDGGFFGWNEMVDFSLSVSDLEDGSTTAGTIDCGDIVAQVLLGHDAHAHPSAPFTTCEDSFSTSPEGHVTYEDELYILFQAQYTDTAPSGTGSLMGSAIHLLHPKRKQAEHFSSQKGIVKVPTMDSLSLLDLAVVSDSAWFTITPMNLRRLSSLQLRLSGSGGQFELWKGAIGQNGQRVISEPLPVTMGDQDYVTSAPMGFIDPTGTDEYYFLFLKDGRGRAARINWFEFEGPGVSVANDNFLPSPKLQAAPITWKAWPNPAESRLWLEVQGQAGELDVQVMDNQGRVLKHKTGRLLTNSPWKTAFELEGLAAGLYFIRVAHEGFVGFEKVVIR